MTANLTFKRKLPLGELSKDKSVNKFFSGGVRKSFSLACQEDMVGEVWILGFCQTGWEGPLGV